MLELSIGISIYIGAYLLDLLIQGLEFTYVDRYIFFFDTCLTKKKKNQYVTM